jgi:hypothetical protein
MYKKIKRKYICSNIYSSYTKFDFIGCSTEEMERIWSIDGKLLIMNCVSLSPFMFECILY